MKFTCSSSEMYSALSNTTKALSSRPTQQILNGVLLETRENAVELTCSDGVMSIRSVVQAQVEKPGRVVMPGRLFTDIVRMLPSGTAGFDMDPNYAMTIRCMQSRSKISGMSSEDFPAMMDLTDTPAIHVPQKKLKDMIGKVAFAIAQQESRQALTGCLFEMTKNELRLVGLDGFRLALQIYHDDFVLPAGTDMIKEIIHGRVAGEIRNLMSDDDSCVTLHFGNGHIMAVVGNTTLSASLLAGEYIRYRDILPKEWSCRVLVERRSLLDAAERASLIAREGRNNLIKMKITQNQVLISSNSEMGDAQETIEAETTGTDLDIAFNSRYIIDVLKNIDDDHCMLSMNSSISPCVITSANSDEYLYLVLPVRTYA